MNPARTTRDDASSARSGVSAVLPVCGGEGFLDAVVPAVLAQDDGRPFELLLVDDEAAPGRLERFCDDERVVVVPGPRRGAAAALNTGFRHAQYPLIAQVDQDVVLHRGWLERLGAALEDPSVAAAQGRYTTDRDSSLWARAAGYDLALRYSRIRDPDVDHVCTGNSLYRAEAVRAVGGFDESLGYGYDNDLSYRLVAAGHRLVFEPSAESTHAWRQSLVGYLRQQYGQGYGRLDLVSRFPGRVTGDAVSGLTMILHAPAMLVALATAAAFAIGLIAGTAWWSFALVSGVLVAGLTVERLWAALAARRLTGDRAALAMVPAHLLRDLAWSAAIVVWTLRRAMGQERRPVHSMTPRTRRAP